jgi:hypothetical protein
MKIKTTIEIGVVTQNVEINVPEILLENTTEEALDKIIDNYVRGWALGNLKVKWERLN